MGQDSNGVSLIRVEGLMLKSPTLAIWKIALRQAGGWSWAPWLTWLTGAFQGLLSRDMTARRYVLASVQLAQPDYGCGLMRR